MNGELRREMPLFRDITYEKVEQVIALARAAERDPPEGPAPTHRRPVTHEPPLRPQPAADWNAALPRYLADLSDRAVAELESLYRFGKGEFGNLEGAVETVCGRRGPRNECISFLTDSPDLVPALEKALERW